jgi:hydrogenase maturation protein HypF
MNAAARDRDATARLHIRVVGIVQGVGFRPWIHRLATSARLTGFVGNDAGGVFIEVQGPRPALGTFVDALTDDPPPLAVIDEVAVTTIEPHDEDAFVIMPSRDAGEHDALVSPDVGTCDDCLDELWDPADRRHRYPFINCTNCGPRFTIVRGVPYDRPLTTMAGFTMCPACDAEYHDPTDRRFHAQPVCCPDCGPTLSLVSDGSTLPGDPIQEAAALLADGQIVAVKGLGGFHLAVDATNEDAIARLRSRKHREERPFAVMVASLDAAAALADLQPAEADLLADPARPIVLVARRDPDGLTAGVAPGNRSLGLMLPYTPVHHLLLAAVDRPIVLTSGNVSDEPIAHLDDDAFARLADLADAFLTHDRPIHTRTDDSVMRLVGPTPLPVRRSRGYVPRPIAVPWAFPQHVLACGAELKNTICLARDHRAFVSHHIGDLENWETMQSFLGAIDHLSDLFHVRPTVLAHDLHPDYLSTAYARDRADADPDLQVVEVQHHHAHIASCLADNRVQGPVIGVAFDGLGYGTDGTLWGGEFLVADLVGADRVAHLRPVSLPGGATAIREPWRMAASYLDTAGIDTRHAAVAARHPEHWDTVVAMARSGTNAPPTSSMGRLFDAVASIAGLHDTVTFEGQAAIALEQAVDLRTDGTAGHAYEVAVADTSPGTIDGSHLVRQVLDDVAQGVPTGVIAARFHAAIVTLVVDVCRHIRDDTALDTVALSGGVFQNALLVGGCVGHLRQAGFTVLTHRQVPPNDGGISLGQAVVAAARARAGR